MARHRTTRLQPALEDKVSRERRTEEGRQGPDNPRVLFKDVSGSSGVRGGYLESFFAVACRQAKEAFAYYAASSTLMVSAIQTGKDSREAMSSAHTSGVRLRFSCASTSRACERPAHARARTTSPDA